MSTETSCDRPFDPYHEWLGIPADRQPASPYRLLGVSPFERDPDVIETAGRLRSSFLDRHRSGPQGAAARKLAEEVTAAVDSLLDPQRRERCERDWSAAWQVEIGAKLPFDFMLGDVALPDGKIADGQAEQGDPVAPLPPHLLSQAVN